MIESWPTGEIDEFAFQIMILKSALTFWGRPWDAPLSASTDWDRSFPYRAHDKEKSLVEHWQSFQPEDREAALERTLNHFVGGALQAAGDEARRRRMVIKSNVKW
ncbi:MAG: hypothetical protein JRN03_07700 [Nitrososphaerota archaeon]|nr:hypothetical protein [Nitrososphaerota archaeon]